MSKKEFEILMYALYRANQLFIPEKYTIQQWINVIYHTHCKGWALGVFSNGRVKIRKDEKVYWEKDLGVKYPVIWRKKGNIKCDPCPYCGEKHKHGDGEGHRVSHCKEKSIPNVDVFILHNGKPYHDNGYILKEYSSLYDKSMIQIRLENASK